jgi:hypothetical protein
MAVSQVVRRGLRYEVHPLMSQALHRPVAEVGGETESVCLPLGDNKNNVNIHIASVLQLDSPDRFLIYESFVPGTKQNS